MRQREFKSHRTQTEVLEGYGDGIAVNEDLNVTGDIAQTGNLTVTGTVTTTIMPIIPTATVAATGTNQATGASVTTGFTLVTAADATKAVVLPTAAAGLVCILKNNVNAALPVFPAASDAINAIAADSAYTMAALTSLYLVAYDDTTWYTLPLLGS